MKKSSILCKIILGVSLTLGFHLAAYAAPDGYLTKDKETGEFIEYSLEDLANSYLDYVMNDKSPLFDDYLKKDLKAIHDNKQNKYINIDNIIMELAIENLDLNNYIENPPKDSIFNINDKSIIKVIEKDGKLYKEKKDDKFSKDSAMDYFLEAEKYMQKQKFNDAIENFTMCLKLNPNLGFAYSERGMAYYSVNEYDKSLQDLNKSIELNCIDGYFNRGFYYSINKKDYKKALDDYDNFIKLSLKDTSHIQLHTILEVYLQKNELYRLLNDSDSIIKNSTEAIQLCTHETKEYLARFYKDRALAYMKKGCIEFAKMDITKAYELQPEGMKYHYNYIINLN